MREKIIAIMLDVQGTIDQIDDSFAKEFMEKIEQIRIKFGADKAIINLSSHMYNPFRMVAYLRFLDRNLLPHIFLDEATYMSGTFNYYTKEETVKENFYNSSKIDIFLKKYLNNYNVLWFAIIDDSASYKLTEKFKENQKMVVIRPSSCESDLKYDNFMCYSSTIKGFYGVIQCLDVYLECIQNMTIEEIEEQQKAILPHLSAWHVQKLCLDKSFLLIKEYIEKNRLDEEDYSIVIEVLTYHLKKSELTKKELEEIKQIIQLLKAYLKEEDEIYLLIRNRLIKN